MSGNSLEGELPGEDFVQKGLEDLAQNRVSDFSLLVLIASPRLRRLGIEVPDWAFPKSYEHALYARLEERLGLGAHSYYNSLIRRIVSYARALERERSQGLKHLNSEDLSEVINESDALWSFGRLKIPVHGVGEHRAKFRE
jgi:hypothetical protein